MLLGIYEDPPLHEVRVVLEPSASLVLHTDGVVERGGRHVPFAEDAELALAASAAGGDPERIAASIEAVLTNGHTLADDAAVLVVSAGGEPAEASSVLDRDRGRGAQLHEVGDPAHLRREMQQNEAATGGTRSRDHQQAPNTLTVHERETRAVEQKVAG